MARSRFCSPYFAYLSLSLPQHQELLGKWSLLSPYFPFTNKTFDNFRRNSGFASDARRKEREMKRNRKMMMVLSGISVCFAVSWLPLQIFLIVTEHYNVFQVRLEPGPIRSLQFKSPVPKAMKVLQACIYKFVNAVQFLKSFVAVSIVTSIMFMHKSTLYQI